MGFIGFIKFTFNRSQPRRGKVIRPVEKDVLSRETKFNNLKFIAIPVSELDWRILIDAMFVVVKTPIFIIVNQADRGSRDVR